MNINSAFLIVALGLFLTGCKSIPEAIDGVDVYTETSEQKTTPSNVLTIDAVYPLEDTYLYSNSVPKVKTKQGQSIVLKGVKKGVLIVNAYGFAAVENDPNGRGKKANGIGSMSIAVQWKNDLFESFKKCGTNFDRSNGIWRSTFRTTVNCFIPIEQDGDYSIRILPTARSRHNPRSGFQPTPTYETRYLLITGNPIN